MRRRVVAWHYKNSRRVNSLEKCFCCIRPRPHYTVFKRKRYYFVPDTATVHTTTPKTINESGSIRKRSPEWNDLKMALFENAVFLVWTSKTMLSENDDVITTTPSGCRLLNREYPRWRTDSFWWLSC